MAQKIQTLFIDDLDGSEAEGTIHFALDGTHYEIDLSTTHGKELRTALARYTEAARKVSGPAWQPARNRRAPTTHGHSTTEVRDWARTHGIEVKERGRVPADVAAKFLAATSH